MLDTIASTIREYQKASKSGSSGSSNENAEQIKRRRESMDNNSNEHDDDFAHSAAQSKKRVPKSGSNQTVAPDSRSMSGSYHRCIDVDLDGRDDEVEESASEPKQQASGRVLPHWSKSGNKGRNGTVDNLFREFVFKK